MIPNAFMPIGVAEISQIFLREPDIYNLAMRYTADVIGGKPIVVYSQSISGRKGEVFFTIRDSMSFIVHCQLVVYHCCSWLHRRHGVRVRVVGIVP
jgi:hypothetical protein